MSDGDDESSPLADGGSEEPNLGDYVHEPAVDDEDDAARRRRDADGSAGDRARESAAGSAASGRGRTSDAVDDGTPGGGTGDRATGGGSRGAGAERTASRGRGDATETAPAGAAPRDARTEARPAPGTESGAGGRQPGYDPFAAADEPDVWDRVGTAISRGGVRATTAGIVGAYALLGLAFAALAIGVGGLGLPVLVTTWETFPLVAGGALLTVVPALCLFLALLSAGYATLRHGGTEALVAGVVGAAGGSVVATLLTIPAVALVSAEATIRIDGVLLDLVFLALIAGGLAAGTTLAATTLGLSGDDLAADAAEEGDGTAPEDAAESGAD